MNPVAAIPARFGLCGPASVPRPARFGMADATTRFTPQWQTEAEELMGWLRAGQKHPARPSGAARPMAGVPRHAAFLDGMASLGDGFASLGAGLASLFDFGRVRRPSFPAWRGAADRLSAQDALRGDWEAVTRDLHDSMGQVGLYLREAMIDTLPELMKSAHTDGRGARLVANFYFQAALSQQGDKVRVSNRPALLKAMAWSRIADHLGQEPLPVWIYSPQWQAPRPLRFTLTPVEDQLVQADVEGWLSRHPSASKA